MRQTRVLSVLVAGAVAVGTLLAAAAPATAATDTTTTLESSVNPSTAGQEITLTATVVGDSPTGEVAFADAGIPLDTVPVDSGIATLTLDTLGVGDHALTATYAGDAGNNGSEGDLTQTVVAAPTDTTTALTSSANPSTVGDEITLTATVTGNSPTGQVTFADDGIPLDTVDVSSGVATLTLDSLGVGDHALTATYGGDAGNNG